MFEGVRASVSPTDQVPSSVRVRRDPSEMSPETRFTWLATIVNVRASSSAMGLEVPKSLYAPVLDAQKVLGFEGDPARKSRCWWKVATEG